MIITLNELASDVIRHVTLAEQEDIFIVSNGERIARLTAESKQRTELAKSLFGILPSTACEEDITSERMKRYEKIKTTALP
jgi:intracellular sulfur oxidation DsrE/DsrF family protein